MARLTLSSDIRLRLCLRLTVQCTGDFTITAPDPLVTTAESRSVLLVGLLLTVLLLHVLLLVVGLPVVTNRLRLLRVILMTII